MELYRRPLNLFVAGIIGSPKMNFTEGTVSSVTDGAVTLAIPEIGDVALEVDTQHVAVGDMVTLCVRPFDLCMCEGGPVGGEVLLLERLGNETIANLAFNTGRTWFAVLDGDASIVVGDRISLAFEPVKPTG